MHAAPVLRGGLVARLVWLVVGLFFCSCGVVSFLDARFGLPPWDVLHQGLAKHTPISFGLANIAVGIAVLALAAALGARIGFGTIANATLIGLFVVVLVPIHLDGASFPERIGLLVAGLAFFGFGSALYIGAALGAGPRDSLMLVGSRRSGVRVGAVRAALEVTALALGYALGGRIGVGTVLFAVLIGPAVEGSFWLLARSGVATAQSIPPLPAEYAQ